MVSHLKQFNVDKQKTQDGFVTLQVKPVVQHPAALEGKRDKPVLQVSQIFAELHLVQFKFVVQDTQEELEVLHVTI